MILSKRELAKIIDSEWRYSMHWPDNDWQEKAYEDAKTRFMQVSEEYDDLVKAMKQLRRYLDIKKYDDEVEE